MPFPVQAKLLMKFITGVPFLISWLMVHFAIRSDNASLLKNGLSAEATILSCTHRIVGTSRFKHKETEVRFTFTPTGQHAVELTKYLRGHISLVAGSTVPVKYQKGHPYICLLVPYEKHHTTI